MVNDCQNIKKNFVTRIIKLMIQAIYNTVNHDGVEHSGYMSFLLMLSIFPFFVFFAAVIGTISDFVGIPLVTTLTNIVLKSDFSEFIESLKPRIIEISNMPPQKLLTIAIVSALWTASSIFEAIRTTLNHAYDITKPPPYIFRRMFSILEFVAIIIFVSTIILIVIIFPIAMNFISHYIDLQNLFLLNFVENNTAILTNLVVFSFEFMLIMYIYYFLPNRKQSLKWIVVGSFLVMIAWLVFSKVFKYYILYFPQINFIYGSIAGIAISLLYFYICTFILIYGAEFNYLIEKEFKKN